MATERAEDDLPEAVAGPPRRARWSPIWIVPIVAALVAAGVAVQRVLSEGPTVTITFKSADGIEAGKSVVKYKDVNIGNVTGVRLTDGAAGVEVTAKIAKSAENLMVEDAKFWVVSPRIGLTGISGLSTLLSGNYLGFGVGTSTKKGRSFTGLEVPPIITGGMPGRQFVLQAADLSSLGIGSPLYYRRLQVGQIVAYDLAPDGRTVSIRIFVNAPYDKYVVAGTRFWNASGIDVSLSASGFDVRTQGLVALLEGGIAFDTHASAASQPEAPADHLFTLWGDRVTAMKAGETISTRYLLYFAESVRGLSVGAPVTILGVAIGEVTDVGFSFDPKTLNVRARVEIGLYNDRMIAHLPASQEKAFAAYAQELKRHVLVQQLVEKRGMRAQLATGSFLTGELYVRLAFFPGAPGTRIDWTQTTPELPTVLSTLPELEAKLGSIIAKLEKLPLDAIGEDLKKALVSLNETLGDARGLINRVDADVVPELRSTLDEAKSALAAAERVLSSADSNLVGPNAAGQVEFRNAMQEIARAARSLRVLADFLERHPEALIRGKTVESPPK